jgi:hypothetical protein
VPLLLLLLLLQVRMPSGMKGWKGDVFEGEQGACSACVVRRQPQTLMLYSAKSPNRVLLPGCYTNIAPIAHPAGGVRTFLAVQGPGVTPGAVDSSSLLSIMDILPTVVDLTRTQSTVPHHPEWDGISFASLLQQITPRRNTAQQQQQQQQGAAVDTAVVVAQQQRCSGSSSRGGRQSCSKSVNVQYALQGRYIVILGPQCWGPDAVPKLGADRCGMCRSYVWLCINIMLHCPA